MARKSQTTEILKYMQTHKRGITSKDAFELFGATRLSGIIFSLKKRGHSIDTILEEGKSRFGGKVYFARYILKEIQ